ncbi:MAG: hypothetical protein VKK59_07940, partial [Vampirovibrionales bacterium]|nr:hypothetical protein [Vampirovibrionales bacterium]
MPSFNPIPCHLVMLPDVVVLTDFPKVQSSEQDALFLSYQIAALLRGSLVLRQQILASPDVSSR